MPTIGSLFSGIGGIDLAFQEAGFQIAYQVEINDYCTKVLEKHWPGIRRYADIFSVDAGTLPAADVITGGFPCQPFSVAGNQRGEDDERFLWPEILRIVTAKNPRVVFLENVPGLRTNDSGRTFKRILRELAEIGYDAQWHHLRASDVGAPHRRERLFIVAYAQRERQPQLQGSQPNIRRRSSDGSQAVGNAKRFRYIQANIRARETVPNQNRNGSAQEYGWYKFQPGIAQSSNRQAQSRLGGATHGLSDRLDRHQFPAPPGKQYDWEPPRTTAQTANRTDRIKGLGNAVLPQVVFPIALAIKSYLEVS